jgi:hypothetical protein
MPWCECIFSAAFFFVVYAVLHDDHSACMACATSMVYTFCDEQQYYKY